MITLFKSLDAPRQALCLSYARALVWSSDPSINESRWRSSSSGASQRTENKKRATTKGRPDVCDDAGVRSRLGAGGPLRRPGILAAGIYVAIHELDHGHGGVCRHSGSQPSSRGNSRRGGPCSAGRARRRACAPCRGRGSATSPGGGHAGCRRGPRLMSFSTTGRRSFALGSVVMICSCLISAADMFANIALRCSTVRLKRRPAKP